MGQLFAATLSGRNAGRTGWTTYNDTRGYGDGAIKDGLTAATARQRRSRRNNGKSNVAVGFPVAGDYLTSRLAARRLSRGGRSGLKGDGYAISGDGYAISGLKAQPSEVR
jgi:hypothetical protein